VVGVGPAADGTPHAREGKELGPGTAEWLAATTPDLAWPSTDPDLFERVRTALQGPAAAVRVDGWHVRDLAPDVVRIELTGLDRHDSERLLRAMARATADVHGVDVAGFAAAVAEVGRDESRFHDAVRTMVASVEDDFAAYRA
jgi:hypothetical protein